MVTVIKRGSTKEQIKAELDRHDKKRKKKGIELSKYFGSINLKEDPLKLQKLWRNEWE